MANRIIATFSKREIESLGERRWDLMKAQLTPVLNVLAGEIILWAKTQDGEMATASLSAETGYRSYLDAGFRGPARHRGGAVNIWGSSIGALAWRLDSMDVSPEVVAVLRELFKEIGQLAKDAQAL